MSMFGNKEAEETTNPEEVDNVPYVKEHSLKSRLGSGVVIPVDKLGDIPEAGIPMNEPNLVPVDNQSLQTVVKTTLEDFYSAIERVKAVTVELDKIANEADSRIRN